MSEIIAAIIGVIGGSGIQWLITVYRERVILKVSGRNLRVNNANATFQLDFVNTSRGDVQVTSVSVKLDKAMVQVGGQINGIPMVLKSGHSCAKIVQLPLNLFPDPLRPQDHSVVVTAATGEEFEFGLSSAV